MAVIRVLLIEDDPNYSRLIERVLALSPIGFNITVAITLKAAESALAEDRFNLILTVLNLPDIKGLDTIEAVRSAEPTLPIVVLTGVEDVELKPQAISRGAQSCLCKSEIDTKSLLDAMHQAVRISRQSALVISHKHVNQFLAQLEEDIVALEHALGILDEEHADSQKRDAFQTIRSHVGKMQRKIGNFRQLQG